MRVHSLIGVWVVVAMATGTGCGSNASATYDQIIRAYCEYGARCGGGDGAAIDRCATRLADQLHASGWNLEDASAAGRVTVDGGKAGACADLLRNADCSQLFGGMTCNFASGTVQNGGACTDAAECVAGSYCARPRQVSGCPGTCAPLPTAGQPCANYQCADGFYCTGGTNALCAAKLADGSPCSSAAQCQTGLTCREPAVGAAKICRAYGSAGQPCGATFTHDCARGLFCDTSRTPATCATRVGEGQPCGESAGCVDGLFCAGATAQQMGSCTRPFATGASCTPGEDGCAFGLVCDATSSKCAVPSPREGTPCTTTQQCEDGADARDQYCAAGTCRPKPHLGESCTPSNNDACTAGSCSATTNVCTLVCM